MSEGKRPGGLTALAVLNFVFGGFGALAFLGFLTLLAVISGAAAVSEGSGTEDGAKVSEALKDMPMGLFYVTIVLTAVSAFLLIASGVGYLKQKKFLGRTLGNTYGLLAIASSLISGLMIPVEANGGFGIGTIIGLIYPLLTLMLLNTTFKEDFIR